MKMNFRFFFHFGFDFCFCFCFLKVFAFLLILRGLEVPQMVNCLLIDLKVPQHFFQLHVAQRCHRRSTLSYLAQICHSILFCEFSTWPSGAIDGQLSLHGLEVQQHLEIWHLASFEYAEFNDAVHFFRFRLEIPFLSKFGPKNFKVNLTQINSNIQNSMVVFTFFFFDQKCLFWPNLVQNVKLVGLRLNLVASLIRICRIQ